MERWIKVMAAMGSTGLSDALSGQRIDPETLPISAALKIRIAAWMKRYAYLNIRGDATELIGFAKEGLDIARAIKRELPKFRVKYHDFVGLDREDGSSPEESMPRPCDYEIIF